MPEAYFIQDDGYSLWGRVQRWPGLYPEAIFKYRPALPEFRRRFAETFGAERDAYARKLLSERIDGLRQKVGDEPMPLNPDQLHKLHADLYAKLLNHVLGQDGPDLELMEKNSEPASTSG
jgi:hypothetical protein